MGIAFCAFTFIQCSDHYSLNSGTWNGEKPKGTYQGHVTINGKTPNKNFKFNYASGVVGNNKAFIKPTQNTNTSTVNTYTATDNSIMDWPR